MLYPYEFYHNLVVVSSRADTNWVTKARSEVWRHARLARREVHYVVRRPRSREATHCQVLYPPRQEPRVGVLHLQPRRPATPGDAKVRDARGEAVCVLDDDRARESGAQRLHQGPRQRRLPHLQSPRLRRKVASSTLGSAHIGMSQRHGETTTELSTQARTGSTTAGSSRHEP